MYNNKLTIDEDVPMLETLSADELEEVSGGWKFKLKLELEVET
jgi:bacteriocin-like protein